MNEYNEYNVDEIVESSNPRAGLLLLTGIIGFFVFLAIAVPAIKAAGGSTDSLFFAVIGAVAAAIVIPVLLNGILAKLQLQGKSRREIMERMMGYTPYCDEEETMMPDYTQIVESFYEGVEASRALVPYAFEGKGEEITDETAIIEENPMHLADDYQPNIDSFLSSCFTLIGIRRSGKSNAIAVISEELAQWGTPLCVCDTEDEYAMLAGHRYMPRGILAGSIELINANPDLRNFITINTDGAYEFGQTIIAEGLQVVLNLKSFQSDDEAAYIMCAIIAGMNTWEEARKSADRVSSMVIIDEANKWLPQNLSESILSKEAQIALQNAIFGLMVRRGGKRGLGLGLATQRIVELDKRALQSQWKFLFRQTEAIDIQRYAALGLDTSEVPTLQNGECYIYSPNLQGWPIQMRERHSPHGANTPGLASVLKHRAQLQPLADMSTRSFSGSQSNTADPDTEPVQATPVHFTVPAPAAPKRIDLTPYAEAWNAGANSVRKLQEACHIKTYYEAVKMRHMLVEARLID